MAKKEQTNGGSASFRIVTTKVDEKGQITVEEEKARKLTIPTVEKLNELEEAEYLEIKVDTHDVFKEAEKVVKRVVNGKEIKVGPVPQRKSEDQIEVR